MPPISKSMFYWDWEELFLVSAPSLRSSHGDLAALAALPWIVTGSPNAIRGQISAIFTQAELESSARNFTGWAFCRCP
jgi:hypothetical protein